MARFGPGAAMGVAKGATVIVAMREACDVKSSNGPSHPPPNRCMVLAIRRRKDMKPFTTLAVVLLALIALAQATRFLLGWEVTIDGIVVPVWLSGIAVVIVGGIAAMLWRESRR